MTNDHLVLVLLKHIYKKDSPVASVLLYSDSLTYLPAGRWVVRQASLD